MRDLSREDRQSTISRSRCVPASALHATPTMISHIRQNAASQLERLINRWAADVVRSPPASLDDIYAAAIGDITGNDEPLPPGASPMQVQNLLRHVISDVISSDIINQLIVTNSSEANIQLTHIHEHLFSREYWAVPYVITLFYPSSNRKPHGCVCLAPPDILGCR